MVLHFEDCVNVLKVLYPDFDFLLLFDHLCRHDKQKEDGLNVERMRKGYGSHMNICDSMIKKEKVYLGPFPHKLKPGDVQSLVFKPSDKGPFWMTLEEHESKCKDQIMEGKVTTRNLKKHELIELLATKGIQTKGTAKELQKISPRQ